MENPHSKNSNNVLGKKSDAYRSSAQEHVVEALNPGNYKEQTIDYWLNEVFWLPESWKRSLKKKVKFSKKLSIFDLFKVVNDVNANINLGKKPLIYLAEQCLNKEYMDMFLDYIEEDKDPQTFKSISVEKFLKLLSSFEEERFQTIHDRADESLKSDDLDILKAYCDNHRDKYNREEQIMSRKKFKELCKLAEEWNLER